MVLAFTMWETIYTLLFAACVFSSVKTIGAVTQPKCPPNELFEQCNPPCPPRYCGVNIAAISCAPSPKPGDPDCKPGCRCRDGYLRNGNLTCIPERKCPKCPTNEVYDVCPAPCPPRVCGVDPRTIRCKAPPTYGDPECEPGCRCQDGYYRNSKGRCVTEEECKCDKPHEYYEKRVSDCPPQTCKSIGLQYDCPKQQNYTEGCRCEKGYYRNLIGECISEKDCLKCPGEHEYFSCGGACDNVCATLSQQNQTNCPIQNIVCNPMCYCEEGYARDYNNVCIPINKCPKPCEKNERLEQCPATLCSPQSCSQLGYPITYTTLADNEKCPVPPACVCNDKLVKDDKGKCIPRNQCPSCGGDPNAESSSVNSGRLCPNHKSNDAVYPFVNDPNGCDCKKGYVLDTYTNKCVRPEKCTPACGTNEKWDSCKNGGCDKRNCTQIGQPRICIDPIKCYGGCVCEKGYLRSKNGSCIPVNQCPESQCNRPNEHFDACPLDCSPGTCESIGKSYSCPAVIDCNPSCVCNKGYYRNLIGDCISEKDCLKCRGVHEYWSCGPACDNVCATLHQQSQDNCPIKNVKCSPMCYCEKGHARNSKNECIPIDECPPCHS